MGKRGEAIGPYPILGELARGGQAVVYRCATPDLKGEVAVKVLHRAAPDDVARRRFEREAGLLARLAHPNLVRVLEQGDERGQAYVVMELVQGLSLAERLRTQGPLPAWEAAELTAILARALHHAHCAGIVHRDVNPSNIVLTPAGPVLVDFGLAKAEENAQDQLSKTGCLLGTLGYMAPEQVKGQKDDVDGRADVHGLGATLYAMLTGHAPYRGQALEVLDQTLSAIPEPPGAIVEVPRELERVCMRCLAKHPDDRYPDAEQLAEALERPAETRPSISWGPAAIVLLPLALLLALGVGLTSSDEGDPSPGQVSTLPKRDPELATSDPPVAEPTPPPERRSSMPTVDDQVRAARARAQLLKDVRQVPQPKGAVSGGIGVYGPQAFAVLTGVHRREAAPAAVVGAAFHGRGRVVAAGHHSFFHSTGFALDGWRFVANTISWLGAAESLDGLEVGILISHERTRPLVERLKGVGASIQAVSLRGLKRSSVKVVVWYALNSWDLELTREELAPLLEYVRAGGGLWIGACPWGIAQLFPIDVVNAYPQNWVLSRVGLVLDPDGTVKPSEGDVFQVSRSRPELVHGGRAIGRLLGWEQPPTGWDASAGRALAERLVRSLPREDRVLVPKLLAEIERSPEGRFRRYVDEASARYRWER